MSINFGKKDAGQAHDGGLPVALPPQTESRLTWVAVLAVGVVLVLLGWPLVAGRVYFFDDLGNLALGMRHSYAQALAAGDSFIWSPYLYCGYYLQGDGQAGMTHPWHWLLYRTLPLDLAFNTEFLANYVVLGLGFFLLLRRWRFERPVAVFGSMVFTFGGFSLMHFMHLHAVGVIAHLPWLIICNDIVLCTTNRKHVALAQLAVALLTASQLLIGYPPQVILSLLAEAVFILWRCRDWAAWWRLPLLLLSKLLGLAMAAVQILPTWEGLNSSVRHGASLAFRLEDPLHPLNLIQLWAPLALYDRHFGQGNTHELGLYVGAFCTAALPWLWIRRHALGPRRGLTLVMLALAAWALVMAFGKYGGLFGPLTTLPLVKRLALRDADRFVFLVQLALVVLACVALADMMHLVAQRTKIPWRRLWPFGLLAALAVATAAGAIWIHHGGLGYSRADRIDSDGKVLGGMVLVLLAIALVLGAARGRRWSIAGIILLACADIAVLGIGLQVHRGPIVPLREVTGPVSPALPPDAGRVYAEDKSLYPGDTLALRNYRQFDGYMSLGPMKLLDPLDLNTLRVAGVSHVFADGRWTEVPHPMPKARFVSVAEVSRDPGWELPKTDPEQVALVEAPLNLEPGDRGRADLLTDRPGRLIVAAATPTRQLLVLAESYHAGWRATLDGRPATVLRADGDFLGLVVEPGTHRIELRFEPWSFIWGLRISLLALAAALAGGAIVFFCGTTRRPDWPPSTPRYQAE